MNKINTLGARRRQSGAAGGNAARRFCFARNATPRPVTLLLIIALACCAAAIDGRAAARQNAGQQNAKQKTATAQPSIAAPQLTRTATRTLTRRLGYGSTVSVVGAPRGAITIEGWDKGEFELSAEIELRAPTEADLDRLAAVNTFSFDEDTNHLRVTTVGMHDKQYLRRTDKNFPKHLLAMPWKIDYRLRVPRATDLKVYAGEGALNLSGVESAIEIEGDGSDARLELAGGLVRAIISRGSVRLKVLARSWRGSGAMIQLGAGDLTVEMPPNFSADVSAEVLKTGRIEKSYDGLTPLERTTPTERAFKGRAGAGGAMFALTVGDGRLRIVPSAD